MISDTCNKSLLVASPFCHMQPFTLPSPTPHQRGAGGGLLDKDITTTSTARHVASLTMCGCTAIRYMAKRYESSMVRIGGG